MTRIIYPRNVNDAFATVMNYTRDPAQWRFINPRNLPTMEMIGTFITEYQKPRERVLFDPVRDCNPFFHFFESLWILAGRDDVEYLAQFNPKMRDYSDNGLIFHAPYGMRLRGHFAFDQILKAIEVLSEDPNSRQVVLTIWDPRVDMGVVSKDIPCNDLIFLKVRGGELNMTVCCRSNDIIWGAYGANAVQFSVIQEFIASALHVEVGTYTQISDSFHIYTENDAFKRIKANLDSKGIKTYGDPYTRGEVRPAALMHKETNYLQWLSELETILGEKHPGTLQEYNSFFSCVYAPLWHAWQLHKAKKITDALVMLDDCVASDWRRACVEWIERRAS